MLLLLLILRVGAVEYVPEWVILTGILAYTSLLTVKSIERAQAFRPPTTKVFSIFLIVTIAILAVHSGAGLMGYALLPPEAFHVIAIFTLLVDISEYTFLQFYQNLHPALAFVSIGEDVGASLTTVALIKRHYPQTRIIARGISYIHTAILETMNVHEIINPESAYADQLAERFSLKGSLKAIPIDDKYEIVELDTPKKFVGKRLKEVKLSDLGEILLVTVLRMEEKMNFLGKTTVARKSPGRPGDSFQILQGDVLALFGKDSDRDGIR